VAGSQLALARGAGVSPSDNNEVPHNDYEKGVLFIGAEWRAVAAAAGRQGFAAGLEERSVLLGVGQEVLVATGATGPTLRGHCLK
jgi:hypothetical protein